MIISFFLWFCIFSSMPTGAEEFIFLPFDHYCPSLVKKACIPNRICRHCGMYFPSIAAMGRHAVSHNKPPGDEDTEEEEEEEEEMQIEEGISEDAPVYKNIFDIMLMNPFEEC